MASGTPPPWKYKNQEFVLHNVHFTSPEPDKPDLECAMILDPRMIPLIPPNLLAATVPDPPCFEIRDAGAGKGAGMFALKDIPAGGLILPENPAIIIPAPSFPREFGAYEALYEALPGYIRTDLLKMANWKSPEECCREEGIARTNGTDVDLSFPDEMNGADARAGAREYGATFLKIDRCNHSCSPNAAHKWDVGRFASDLYALRDVRAGEEICITYTDITAPRQTRRAKLEKSYGFLCCCPGCLREVEESDRAREELHDWWYTNPSYGKWWKDLCRSDDAVITSHERALGLTEREGLHALQGHFIEEIALCYAVLGNEDAFRTWGRRLVQILRIPAPQQASQFEIWVSNPRSMKLWAWREKQRRQRKQKRCISLDMLC